MTSDKILHVVRKWKHFWMNQKQHSQEDYENYRNRAYGIDSNMSHHLADMIVKEVTHDARIKIEALELTVKRLQERTVERSQKLGIAIKALSRIHEESGNVWGAHYNLRHGETSSEALTAMGVCTCDARFSGMDEAEYCARGCPSCNCFKEDT